MKKLAFVLSSAIAASIAPRAFAQDATAQTLGGAGESCRARSDCAADLRCVDNKCMTAADAAAASKQGGGGAGTDDWMAFNVTDGNTHPYVGFTAAGGFMTAGISGNTPFTGGFDTFNGAFLFALNGGVFFGNHQLSFEIAPVTYVYDAKAPGPVFEMTGNYAYFVPLMESGHLHVYWPIRVGLGMMAGPDNNVLGLALFQVRADLIGAAFQIGHIVIDLHLPTFRYAITDKNSVQLHLLDWLFGTSIGYAF